MAADTNTRQTVAVRDQVKEITDRLEAGMQELFTNEKFTEYLKTMSRFHRYSTNNVMLIYMQLPNATKVAGFNAWKENFGRTVKKGEKGLRIFAPIANSKTKEVVKTDPETGAPMLDDNFNPIIEKTQVTIPYFKLVPVFDVSQTEGKPLPQLVEDLTGDVQQYEAFMDALRAISPLPIVFETLPDNTDGLCYYGDRIALREGMSQIQTVCAAVHEIGHAVLHDKTLNQDENAPVKDNITKEVEAESVSYAVCQHYGIETSPNSLGYLATFTKDKDMKALKASLDTIRKTAAELIDAIDGKFKELVKERGIELATVIEQPIPETAAIPEPARTPSIPAAAKETRSVGENVLMPLVFDGGNFNRTGKRSRVQIEPSIGKYQIYSREDGERKDGYILTDSGMLYRVGEYDRLKTISEERIDTFFGQQREAVETAMQDPNEWVDYHAAAIANRLDEAETHNVPIRAAREAGYENERRENAEQQAAEQREKEAAFNAKVEEMGTALVRGERVDVDAEHYTDKNPLFALCEKYGIEIPIQTKGWVNRNLKAVQINDDGLTAWGPKDMEISEHFTAAMYGLKNAIIAAQPELAEKPVEAQAQNDSVPTPAAKPLGKQQGNYQKFVELFPLIANGEYNYIRFESEGFEPLSVEWIDNDHISVMHTYDKNGDLCYDPMMVFSVDTLNGRLTATAFEQSEPPLYQFINEDGIGQSVDGNGRQVTVNNLREKLNDFASQWFSNISEQGFMPVRGKLEIDDEDIKVTFDGEGQPIMPEQSTASEKEYDLGFGLLGNGITVWNRAEERNGDYVTVAHIERERTVTFYDKNMPDEVKDRINTAAQSMVSEALDPLKTEDAAEPQQPGKLEYHDIPVYGVEVYSGQEQIANVLDTGFVEYFKDDIPQAAIDEIEAFAKNRAEEHEARFMNMEGDAYGIYLFEQTSDNTSIVKENYRLAWFGELGPDETLDTIKATFTGEDHPFYDYHARQNGVRFGSGDIIATKKDGEIAAWYVNDLSFHRERGFFGQVDTLIAEQTSTPEPEYAMPDLAIGISEMNLYGYSGDETILPLTQNRALELFDADHTVYLLYEDDTEAMVFDRAEIEEHDGIFGIEVIDWEATYEFADLTAAAKNSEVAKESALIYSDTDVYGIYQLKSGDEYRNHRFEPLSSLEASGLSVQRGNYELVYTAQLDKTDTLDSLYDRFNSARPDDFKGHSMSVSDVVVLNRNGEITSHYVDDFGFSELPAFLGHEQQPEIVMPDVQQKAPPTIPPEVTGPSVAELDAQVKAGQSISLTDLANAVMRERKPQPAMAKTSVLSTLAENMKIVAERQAAPKRDDKKEVLT